MRFNLFGKPAKVNWLHILQLVLGAAVTYGTLGLKIGIFPTNSIAIATAALTLVGLVYKSIFHTDPTDDETPLSVADKASESAPSKKSSIAPTGLQQLAAKRARSWSSRFGNAISLVLLAFLFLVPFVTAACAAFIKSIPNDVQLLACVVDDAAKGDSLAQIASDCNTDIPGVIGNLTSAKAKARNPSVASTPAYAECLRVQSLYSSVDAGAE